MGSRIRQFHVLGVRIKKNRNMSDMKTYTLFWKNEDTNRVSSKDFANEAGTDHAAMDKALELAQEADTNMWPWILEEDGCTVAHGWGGDMIGAYRFQG